MAYELVTCRWIFNYYVGSKTNLSTNSVNLEECHKLTTQVLMKCCYSANEKILVKFYIKSGGHRISLGPKYITAVRDSLKFYYYFHCFIVGCIEYVNFQLEKCGSMTTVR